MKSITLIIITISICISCFGQNNPPVADPGGPYTGTRTDAAIPLTLGAHDSYDPDEPLDEIVKYKWDTDGDGLYGIDDTDGSFLYSPGSDAEGVEVQVVTDWYPGDSYPVSLIVEDSNGASSSVASTTINIVAYGGLSFPANIHTLEIDEAVSGDALFRIRISHPHADAQIFDAEFMMMPAGQPFDCFDSEGDPLTQLSYSGGNVISEYEIWFNSTEFADRVDYYSLRTKLTKSGEAYETTKTTRPFTIDNTAPEITCPGNQDRDADQTNAYTTIANEFDLLSATDNFSIPSISNDINSLQTLAGYAFSLGETIITWSAEDNAGNISTCNFDINVSTYTGVEEIPSADIHAYPNPVGDNLNIVMEKVPISGSLKIISSEGRILFDQPADRAKLKVDCSAYPKGIYTLLVLSKDEIVSSLKIVKK